MITLSWKWPTVGFINWSLLSALAWSVSSIEHPNSTPRNCIVDCDKWLFCSFASYSTDIWRRHLETTKIKSIRQTTCQWYFKICLRRLLIRRSIIRWVFPTAKRTDASKFFSLLCQFSKPLRSTPPPNETNKLHSDLPPTRCCTWRIFEVNILEKWAISYGKGERHERNRQCGQTERGGDDSIIIKPSYYCDTLKE